MPERLHRLEKDLSNLKVTLRPKIQDKFAGLNWLIPLLINKQDAALSPTVAL